MTLSRTDLLPVLTIVAGGVIGASLSVGFLGSRSADVPPQPVRVVNDVTEDASALDVVGEESRIVVATDSSGVRITENQCGGCPSVVVCAPRGGSAFA